MKTYNTKYRMERTHSFENRNELDEYMESLTNLINASIIVTKVDLEKLVVNIEEKDGPEYFNLDVFLGLANVILEEFGLKVYYLQWPSDQLITVDYFDRDCEIGNTHVPGSLIEILELDPFDIITGEIQKNLIPFYQY